MFAKTPKTQDPEYVFEYTSTVIPDKEDMLKRLNNLGAEGWEVVSFHPPQRGSGTVYRALLKRRGVK